MTLQERIEERKFQKRCRGYKISILVLIIMVGFLGGMCINEMNRCESLKTTVITYDFERGKRELIDRIKEI